MIFKMAKWFFHASYTPKIDGKVDIAQKRLLIGSPDQFSYFYIVFRFFLRKQYIKFGENRPISKNQSYHFLGPCSSVFINFKSYRVDHATDARPAERKKEVHAMEDC